MDRVSHWQQIYSKKESDEVSWYQESPEASLTFILKANPDKQSPIIDIGGGDSRLVDRLCELGYEDITVLDISENALTRAQKRLGEKAKKVNWIQSDILDFIPSRSYAIWHDRAAFHFLTNDRDVKKYIETAGSAILQDGHLILATFSENGPEKCSGLEITRYSEKSLIRLTSKLFQKIKCEEIPHVTPANTIQYFMFCRFRPKKSD